jgi:transcriptional regulator GlxA family with amidase domain
MRRAAPVGDADDDVAHAAPLRDRAADDATRAPEHDELDTARPARVAGVSPRHLTRLFLAELATTPGRYVRHARTEAAAQLLAGPSLTMPAVAGRCGFSSAEALRQAFVARYRIPPSRYRAAHRER